VAHESRVDSILRNAGLSQTGARFVRKALHPASDLASPGIPDTNEVDLFRVTLRTTQSVNAPIAGTAWDCLIWTPPGDNTATIVARGLPGTDFRAATLTTGVPTAGEVLVTREHFSDNVTLHAFGGTLSSFNVATVNGASPGVSSPPPVREFGATCGALLPRRWRTTASSVTTNLIANATQNEGTCYAWEGGRSFSNGPAFELINATPIGVWDQATAAAWHQSTASGTMSWAPGTGTEPPAPFNADELYEVVQTKVTSVPFDESDMIAQTPDLYVTNAYNGVYAVHRFLGPDQPLQNSNDIPPTVVVPTKALAPTVWSGDTTYDTSSIRLTYLHSGAPTNVVDMPSTGPINVMPLNNSNSDTIDAGALRPAGTFSVPPWLWLFLQTESHPDTSMDNVSQCVQIYRGLNGSASLQVKRILSLEAAPMESSSARPFVTPPLDFEPQALKMYYQISHRMHAIHPAEFNDFGSIVDHIAKVAKMISMPIATIVSAFQPELAPLAEGIGSTVSMGASGLQALVKAGRKNITQRAKSNPKPKPKAKKAKVVLRRR